MLLESSKIRNRRLRFSRCLLRATIGIGLLMMLMAATLPAEAINCLTQQMRTRLPADLSELESVPRTETGNRMTPPPNPQVGDSWNWYLWYFVGGPPHYIETMCTVRGVGDNVYVIVSDNDWNVWVDQADVDQIVANWDNSSYGNWPDQGIYQLATENFGIPPDRLDNDPRIYVVLYDWDTSLADGYWNLGDEFPDNPPNNPSNECECLYVDASTSDPGGSGGPYLTAVMAHEFEHMIHWNHDPNESAWVDEGLAELVMWLYGNPDPIVGFPGNPDNDLTRFTASSADYIKTYLWNLYFFEHYGGQAAIYDVVHQSGNGIAGYDATLDFFSYEEDFVDVFSDWVVANWVDDETFLDGRFGYEGVNLPPFNHTLQNTYPVGPVNAAVNHWATDYIRFENGIPQRLFFNGTDNSSFAAQVVTYLAGVPQGYFEITLDAMQDGTLDILGFGTDYDQVILSAANIVSGSSPVQYSYGTESASSVDFSPTDGVAWLSPTPNPLHPGGSLQFFLPQESSAQLDLFDVTGRRVWNWSSPSNPAGVRSLAWNGKGKGGAPLPSGVYYVRLQAGDVITRSRVLVLE